MPSFSRTRTTEQTDCVEYPHTLSLTTVLEMPVHPTKHSLPHVWQILMPPRPDKSHSENRSRAHKAGKRGAPFLRSCAGPPPVSHSLYHRQKQNRARRDQRDDCLRVQVVQQARHIVKCHGASTHLQHQVLVAGQASDGHAGFNPVVQRHQPPGTSRAHADARDADPARIHFRTRRQIIERHQIIPERSFPEASAHPEIELAGRHFAMAPFSAGPPGL